MGYLIFHSVATNRDPNSLSTVKVFNESRDWIAKGEFDHLDVEESKISVFSEVHAKMVDNEI